MGTRRLPPASDVPLLPVPGEHILIRWPVPIPPWVDLAYTADTEFVVVVEDLWVDAGRCVGFVTPSGRRVPLQRIVRWWKT